jgi:hypothetical protein
MKPLNKQQQIKRAQSVFNSEIYGMFAFQTIVVKDWVHTFNQPYNRLKDESGLAIVHSYFAFLGNHHGNTLFQNEKGEISEEVRLAFNKLSYDIKNGEIWNPTLKEFSEYVQPIMSYGLNQLQEFTNYRCII